MTTEIPINKSNILSPLRTSRVVIVRDTRDAWRTDGQNKALLFAFMARRDFIYSSIIAVIPAIATKNDV